MPRLRPVQGLELIKILCNKFGFSKVRQRGSPSILPKAEEAWKFRRCLYREECKELDEKGPYIP